ncbi:MAG: alpha/beta hydrolase [Clostridia bacterium]|nr:alpha/beta hydrolase [Clostridia bacterium]
MTTPLDEILRTASDAPADVHFPARTRIYRFTFEDREAVLTIPGGCDGKWMMKTEYHYAFPATQDEAVRRGWGMGWLQNTDRWGTDPDLDARRRFIDFAADNFGLERRIVPLGMSCGGLIAVNFAEKYPDYVSALYLDAPVMTLLSFPMGFGHSDPYPDVWENEVVPAYGLTRESLLTWRRHPMDRLDAVIAHGIPAALVAGDSDTTVPYDENGMIVTQKYTAAGVPFALWLKPGCDHHPHGIENPADVLAFIERVRIR